MKKLLLLSSALVVGGQAMAADMPIKAPPPPVPVAYSWTGCHAGGHVGAGWDRTTYSDPGTLLAGAPVQNFSPVDTAFSVKSGPRFLGGVQAGCDYQFDNRWVIGIGGDVSWTDLKSVGNTPFNDPFFAGKNVPFSSRTDYIATLTGRVGYSWDRFLVYGKGGAAYAHDKYDVGTVGINEAALSCFAFGAGCGSNGKIDRWGWTAGVGVEWAFAPNWSAMIEYDHYGFDARTVSMGVSSNPGFVVTPANLRVGHDIDAVKVGINYRFWSPAAPVVARY